MSLLFGPGCQFGVPGSGHQLPDDDPRIKYFDRYKKNNEFYFYIYLMYALEAWDERGAETKDC
jgi:hypothetical protein